MGESASTEPQPVKTVCDWILFHAGVQVKKKRATRQNHPKLLQSHGLTAVGFLLSLWKPYAGGC
jgi:hypothetical protein